MAVTVKSWGWRRPRHHACSTSGNCPTRPRRPKSSHSACLLARSPTSSHWRERTRWVEGTNRQPQNNRWASVLHHRWIHRGHKRWVIFVVLFCLDLPRTKCHMSTLNSFSLPILYCIWDKPLQKPLVCLLTKAVGGTWHLFPRFLSSTAALFSSQYRCRYVG